MIVTLGGRTFETRVKHAGAPAPDPRWSCLDANGHRHAWVLEPDRPWSLPTCRAMQFIEVFQGSEVRSLRYECASCGVPIEPGRIVETIREYLIDGHEVTEGDFLRSVDWAALPPTFWDPSSQTVERADTAQIPVPLMSIVYSCPQCQEPLLLVDDDDPPGPLPSFPTTISDLYRCPTHGLWRRALRDGFTPVDSPELS
jgi:hypothetical protein